MSKSADDSSNSGSLNSADNQKTQIRPADPLIGKLLDGRFLIQSLLGRGGMASAYKALHTDMDRIVVIKVMTLQTNEESLRRFQREAQILSKLSNPSIVKVHAFGIFDGMPYMAMDYIEGESLSQLIKTQGTLEQDLVIDLASQVCDALSEAHNAGILHRDIKPSNIMVTSLDGKFKAHLLDFGIAKLTQNNKERTLTAEGDIFGSPPYMSPEQCFGKDLDARSDIYSLGCTLFEMCTGKVPFEGSTPAATIIMHTNQAIPDFLDRNPNTTASAELEVFVHKAMQKNPADRFSSAQEMKSELKQVSESERTSLRAKRKSARTQIHRFAPIILASIVFAPIVTLVLLYLCGPSTFWEFVENTEEALSLDELIPKTEEAVQSSMHREKDSAKLAVRLLDRLKVLSERHPDVYRSALPTTLHHLAESKIELSYTDLSVPLNDGCKLALELKAKQAKAIRALAEDIHTLSIAAKFPASAKKKFLAKEALDFEWIPFITFAKLGFEDLAKSQFPAVAHYDRIFLSRLSQNYLNDKQYADQMVTQIFDAQKFGMQKQAEELANNLTKQLPPVELLEIFKIPFMRLLSPSQTERSSQEAAFFPIMFYLYEKSTAIQQRIQLPHFFNAHLLEGAMRSGNEPLKKVLKLFSEDDSISFVLATHESLIDEKDDALRNIWAEQAKALLAKHIAAPLWHICLLHISLAFYDLKCGRIDEAEKRLAELKALLKDAPELLENARTRILFRLLNIQAYIAWKKGIKNEAIKYTAEFIPLMPEYEEPTLIQWSQDCIADYLKANNQFSLLEKLNTKRKEEELAGARRNH